MSDGLPEGWTKVPFSALLTDLRNGISTRPNLEPPGTPILRISAVRSGNVLLDDHRFLRNGDDLATTFALRDRDLLFTRYNGSLKLLGVCGMVRGHEPAVVLYPDKLMRARVDERITSPAYIELFFQSPEARDAIIAIAKSSAGQQGISGANLKEQVVALAPFAEQDRIVAKVQALIALVTAARDRLAKVPAILKRFRQSVLATACSGTLTEEWRKKASIEPLADTLRRVRFEQSRSGRAATDATVPGRCILALGDPGTPCPPSWRWTPLTDVARLESGHTPTRKHPEYWNGRIPWVGLQDAREHHGGRILQTRQHVTEDGLANSAARLLPSETVCLSRTASVGYVVILGCPMATSQDFVNWVCSEALEPEFLMFALLAEGDSIKNFGRGTTHTTIYFPEVKALHICLPPLAEQREIVRRIRATLPIADSIGRHVAVASARADALTQSILAKAFRGELVPTEAELARSEGRDYESAETLLARTRSERAVSVATPKGSRRLRPRANARSHRSSQTS